MFTIFRDEDLFRIEHEFLTRPKFPAPQCLRSRNCLSKFCPQTMHIQGIFQVKLSHQIGGALIGHARKSDDTQPVHQKEKPGLQVVLRLVFHTVFSHLPGGLEHFTDSKSISWNPPSIFQPDLIATVLQMSLPLLCVPLCLQSH